MAIGDHDRQETADEMALATHNLQRSRDYYEQRGELISPRSGSVLHVERRHTAYQPIDAVAAEYRARTTDNLDQLFDSMMDQERGHLLARTFSNYSLIRPAIESAATALWLVQGGTKAARVIRCLQLNFRDTNDRYGLAELVANVSEGALDEERARRDHVLKRLNELKNSVPTLKQRKLGNPPKYTEILKSVSGGERKEGQPTTYGVISPLIMWKIASSFMHGSSHVTRALSDVRQLTEFDEHMAEFEVTPSIRVLSAAVGACVFTLAAADARYTYLATHDHAGLLV